MKRDRMRKLLVAGVRRGGALNRSVYPSRRRPVMPMTISRIQPSLNTSRGSAKRTVPRIAVPTVPMPVHTAYAVPIGNVFSACASSMKLNAIQITVATVGHRRAKPWVYFKPIAHPTSKSPATTNVSHAMLRAPSAPRLVTNALLRDGAIIAETLEAQDQRCGGVGMKQTGVANHVKISATPAVS
jgi:hypothetical protein